MKTRNARPTPRHRGIRILDMFTTEQLEGLRRWMDMPASEQQHYLCETCDCFGCSVVGRHLGPLLVGSPDIQREIDLLLANPGLLSERRRQTDASIRRGQRTRREGRQVCDS